MVGVLIIGFDEGIDVLPELLDRREGAAVQGLSLQDREPDLHPIEPRGPRRREVEMHVRVHMKSRNSTRRRHVEPRTETDRRRPVSLSQPRRHLRWSALQFRPGVLAIGLTMLPEPECDWKWIDVELLPPSGLITRPMKLAVMDPANRDGKL